MVDIPVEEGVSTLNTMDVGLVFDTEKVRRTVQTNGNTFVPPQRVPSLEMGELLSQGNDPIDVWDCEEATEVVGTSRGRAMELVL